MGAAPGLDYGCGTERGTGRHASGSAAAADLGGRDAGERHAALCAGGSAEADSLAQQRAHGRAARERDGAAGRCEAARGVRRGRSRGECGSRPMGGSCACGGDGGCGGHRPARARAGRKRAPCRQRRARERGGGAGA
ncbi:hypothetical protein JOE45_003666 [Paenibacillus sp. PvR098]|nr:hypothetical protein [Paenibacillus sp. PvP091]MBP1171765.1 hypothetical protein [Paenibacillus sp. PvR098]MBP2438146.1 hypothetical protein [Paenibacillus sp. PvP052]